MNNKIIAYDNDEIKCINYDRKIGKKIIMDMIQYYDQLSMIPIDSDTENRKTGFHITYGKK